MFLKTSSIFTIENHLQTLGSFSNSRAKCVDGEQGQNKNIWFSEKILQIATTFSGNLCFIHLLQDSGKMISFPPSSPFKGINNTYFIKLLPKYNWALDTTCWHSAQPFASTDLLPRPGEWLPLPPASLGS